MSKLVFFAVTLFTLASAADDCGFSETCIPIRSCESIINQLKLARESSDSSKKRAIIASVREKICGDPADKLICCPSSTVGNSNTNSNNIPDIPQSSAKFIGKFNTIFHDVTGDAYEIAKDKILIKGFNYDGEGPDAFFLAGTSGSRPSTKGDVVLGYPYTGKHFEYLSKDIPILPAFDGSEDVTLTLPPGVTVDQLKWLSVWCRDYKVNFGHVTLQ